MAFCREKNQKLLFKSGLITEVSQVYKVTYYSKFCPTRPEGAEALSPGQRPGLLRTQTCRPVRAKAL